MSATRPHRTLVTLLTCAFVLTGTLTASSTATSGRSHDRPSLRHSHGRLVYTDPALAGARTGTLRGRLHVVPSEDGGEDHLLVETTSGGVQQVDLAGVRADVVATGDAFSGEVVTGTATSSPPVAQATITPQLDVAPLTRRLLLAKMTNRGSVTPTDAQILTTAGRIAAYWKDMSDGAISDFTTTSTVKSYVSAYTDPANACGLVPEHAQFDALVAEALAQFPDKGPDETVVVVVPNSCRTTGTAGISTGGVTFNSDNDLLDVAAHEEGHELGLGHANRGTCTPACTGTEYLDRQSIMGSGLNGAVNQLTALNSAFRDGLGWVGAGEQDTLTLPDDQTTVVHDYLLKPRADETGLRSVRVPDPDSDGSYFVENRQRTGADVGSAIDVGSSVAWCCASYAPGISLLRPTGTNQPRSWMHSMAGDGSTTLQPDDGVYTSPTGVLKLQVLADNGAAGATVRVTVTSTLPAMTGSPVITGSPVPEGTGLSVDLAAVSPVPDSTSYQWNLDGVPINDWWARNEYLAPTQEMLGHQLSVTVAMSAADHRTRRVTTAPVTVSLPEVPSNPPVIYDAPVVGRPLGADVGWWMDGAALSYRWLAAGVPVDGATGPSFTPTGAQTGKALTFEVTGTLDGYRRTVRTSAPTAPVEYVAWSPTAPTTEQSAARYPMTFTTSEPFWGSEGTYSYQWLVDGTPVAGATGTTFTPWAGLVNHAVAVRVTGTRPGSAPTVLDSAGVGVAPGALYSSSPVVRGTPRVGHILYAYPRAWTAGTTLRYQWYANSTAIRYATRSSYKIPRALKRKRIRVRVTGTAPGYSAATRWSAYTGTVR